MSLIALSVTLRSYTRDLYVSTFRENKVKCHLLRIFKVNPSKNPKPLDILEYILFVSKI